MGEVDSLDRVANRWLASLSAVALSVVHWTLAYGAADLLTSFLRQPQPGRALARWGRLSWSLRSSCTPWPDRRACSGCPPGARSLALSHPIERQGDHQRCGYRRPSAHGKPVPTRRGVSCHRRQAGSRACGASGSSFVRKVRRSCAAAAGCTPRRCWRRPRTRNPVHARGSRPSKAVRRRV